VSNKKWSQRGNLVQNLTLWKYIKWNVTNVPLLTPVSFIFQYCSHHQMSSRHHPLKSSNQQLVRRQLKEATHQVMWWWFQKRLLLKSSIHFHRLHQASSQLLLPRKVMWWWFPKRLSNNLSTAEVNNLAQLMGATKWQQIVANRH